MPTDLPNVPPQPAPGGLPPSPPAPGPDGFPVPVTDPTQNPPPMEDPDVVDPFPNPGIAPPMVA